MLLLNQKLELFGWFNVRNMRENPTGGFPGKIPGFRVERSVNVL